MKRSVQRALWSALLALITGLALWWVLPPGPQLWNNVLALPLTVWLWATAGLAVSYSLRALRMRDEWASRVNMRWLDGLHLTVVHSAAINLLPMRAGEAGYPWLLHKGWQVSLIDASSSLFWLRVQDALVLCLLALMWFGPGVGPLALGARVALAAVLLAVLALGGKGLAAVLLARWPAEHAGRWHKLLHIGRSLLLSAARAPARGWLWSLGHWSAKIGGLAVIVASLSAQPWLIAFGGALAAEGVSALPVSPPAGFGNYEAGVWLGLHSLGGDASAATVLGAALTAHIFALLIGVLAAAASPWIAPTPASTTPRPSAS